MNELSDGQLIKMVEYIVEQHGCKIVEIDLENHILNIEGPEEAQAECAIALEEALDGKTF